MTQTPSAHEDLAQYSIGPKLRALRAEKGLTLSRVAAEAGISTALLSKLESERMIPTLLTLAKVCRAYGVDLSHFFPAITKHSTSITRDAHISNPRRDLAAVRQTPLNHAKPDSCLCSKIVDIPVGVTFNVGRPRLSTEVTAYVLVGPLHATVLGVLEVLQAGDCIVLDTDAAILFTATNNSCRVLMVFARRYRSSVP